MNGKLGPDDVGGLATLAKLKAQKSMAERLSTTHNLATLPDGIYLSDDVMTKTNAFLNTKPDLN